MASYGDNFIGRTNDYIHVPYTASSEQNTILAHLNTAYYHVHGTAFCYPTLANPVTITADAGAWAAFPTPTEVIPASTLTTSAFDLHYIVLSDISAVDNYEIAIYAGAALAEVELCRVSFARSAQFAQEGGIRIQIPQQSADTRISCALSCQSANANTVGVKFHGHYYAG